jgi:hypothetical protein
MTSSDDAMNLAIRDAAGRRRQAHNRAALHALFGIDRDGNRETPDPPRTDPIRALLDAMTNRHSRRTK